MRPRSELTSADLAELHAGLELRLSAVGIPTQPEVASRILQTVSDRTAQVSDYSKAIRTDAALTGRLLRLTNSAHFAQRTPVTTLDRACALLGVEKLKSFTLGFYLSRAAATEPNAALSRRVWGESVFRANLAAELARTLAPQITAEAFIVGLMLDSGVPLMTRLAGDAFTEIMERGLPPTKQFLAEFRALPFTHVDVVAVLAARWKLPGVLAHPIEWHHVQPNTSARTDDEYQLQRIAYYVGALNLSEAPARAEPAPQSGTAARVLGVSADDLGAAVQKASAEYQKNRDMFAAVADGVPDVEQLGARVHNQLSELLDRSTADAVRRDQHREPPKFLLGGLRVELRGERGGEAVACVYDSGGHPIVSHRFRPEGADAQSLRDAIGLDPDPGDQDAQVNLFLHSLAA